MSKLFNFFSEISLMFFCIRYFMPIKPFIFLILVFLYIYSSSKNPSLYRNVFRYLIVNTLLQFYGKNKLYVKFRPHFFYEQNTTTMRKKFLYHFDTLIYNIINIYEYKQMLFFHAGLRSDLQNK